MEIENWFVSKKLKPNQERCEEDGVGLDVSRDRSLVSSILEIDGIYRRKWGEETEVEVELCDKYILLCCYHVGEGDEFVFPENLLSTCDNLYAIREDFEILSVIKTKQPSDSESSKLLFDEFVSLSVPPVSLVVPFEDTEHRNSICEAVGLCDDSAGDYKFLLVNTNRNSSIHELVAISVHLNILLEEASMAILGSLERLIQLLWPANPASPLLSRVFMFGRWPWPLMSKLDNVLPAYPDDVKKMVSKSERSFPLVIGSSFDVISLLSGGNGAMNYLYRMNGDLVEVDENTFGDKYIMVCCFHAPILQLGSCSYHVQQLVNTCFELFSTRDDIEIVVVAKMNERANYKAVFDYFLSGFPSSCLVVPFRDSVRRDYICYYLHHLRDLRNHSRIRCLILDKGSNNMDDNKWRNILFSGYPRAAMDYGADAFPFTTEKVQELDMKDSPKWETPSTSQLEGLLGCNPSYVLKNIISPAAAGGCEKITISELKEKVVGLYLCKEGNFISTLVSIHQQCRAKQLAFEVVLVYLPFDGCLHPEEWMSMIDTILLQHPHTTTHWWRFPFKNSVSVRLRRLMDQPMWDHVIVLGDHDAFVEPFGEEVIRTFGVNAYPFSREGVVERILSKVKEHTLESLLVYGSRKYVSQGDKKIVVSELVGRNILVYFSSLYDREDYYKVLAWYNEIKVNDPAFEVVFVRQQMTTDYMMEDNSDLIPTMPWLVCPFDPAHSASLEKNFFMEFTRLGDSLIEFGKNGRVCSFNVQCLLTAYGPQGFPFGVDDDSRLRKDVIQHLQGLHNFMHSFPKYPSLYDEIRQLAL